MPLLILMAVLAFPQSRHYLMMQLGVSQTKWGNISSIIFETNKTDTLKPPHTDWEKWDQLIATAQQKTRRIIPMIISKKIPKRHGCWRSAFDVC
jgi:hypothetical protein